jgi:thioredoxin-related protein
VEPAGVAGETGMLKKLLFVLLVSPAVAAHADPVALPVPSDLRQEVKLIQQMNKPLIVLFSLPGCGYCKVVRENYLAPLLRDATPADRPLIREVDITSDAPLKGFGGEALTRKCFAASYGVKLAPTVILMDETGAPLTDRLVGGDTAGFYGAYLDKALSTAQQRLSSAQRGLTK